MATISSDWWLETPAAEIKTRRPIALPFPRPGATLARKVVFINLSRTNTSIAPFVADIATKEDGE